MPKIDSFERMSCDIASKYCPLPYEANGLGERCGEFQGRIGNKPEIMPYGCQNKQPIVSRFNCPDVVILRIYDEDGKK